MIKHCLILIACTCCALVAVEDGWTPLFDGESLYGWKANEGPETWSVVDGAIVANGPVSHLYYIGPDGQSTFEDFELKIEVRTMARNTNSGVFFRQQWQDKGWLQRGLEAQIQNSGQNKCYTGGLWIHAMREEASPVGDEEWFEMHIIAIGDKITVAINGEVTCSYNFAEEKRGHIKNPGPGYLALQGHGNRHRPEFRNIRIKVLDQE